MHVYKGMGRCWTGSDETMNRRSPLERGEERKKKNTFAFIVDLFLNSLQAFT